MGVSDIRRFVFIFLTFCFGGLATAVVILLSRIYIPTTPRRGTPKTDPNLDHGHHLSSYVIPRMFGSHHTFMNPVDAPSINMPWFLRFPLVQQLTNGLLYPQSRSVREQVAAGVRAFDLRIDVNADGAVCICHRWVSTLTLQEALNVLARLPGTPGPPGSTHESSHLIWIRWSFYAHKNNKQKHSDEVVQTVIRTLGVRKGMFDILFNKTWIMRREVNRTDFRYLYMPVVRDLHSNSKQGSRDEFATRICQLYDSENLSPPESGTFDLLMINTFTTILDVSTVFWSILYACVLPAIGGGLMCGLSALLGRRGRHNHPIVTVCVAWLVYCSIVLPVVLATRRRTPLMCKDQHLLVDYQQPEPTLPGMCNSATYPRARDNVVYWLDFV
jgi:hypothetical protein